MTGHHNRPSPEKPVDIMSVWTERCAQWFEQETGSDCGACPRQDECQRVADRRINKMFQGGRGKKETGARAHG